MPVQRKKISYQEFLHREYEFFRAPLAPEMDFYETIRSGNLRKVKQLLNEPIDSKQGLGVLSATSRRAQIPHDRHDGFGRAFLHQRRSFPV